MKTRRLSHGMIEAYNSKFRVRLKLQPEAGHALIIIYHLKKNKYYRHCTVLKVKTGLSIEQFLEICGTINNG